ncbi:MAG: hypothetical protein FRX49_07393 [Trebouxia sp. A1-2]|nr:MAG: hypothetical protein FRX49_07393 [Trebouxia sp. A1-2]
MSQITGMKIKTSPGLRMPIELVHEYGLAIMCASYRRLACADAQRMLGLEGMVADQQLIVLLEALGNRGNQFALVAKDSMLQGSPQLVFRS